jgi:hypothetical protein
MIDLNAQPKHLLTQASLPDKVLWLATFIQWYEGFYTSCFRNWDFQIWKKWKYHREVCLRGSFAWRKKGLQISFGVCKLQRDGLEEPLSTTSVNGAGAVPNLPPTVLEETILFNTMEIWAMTHICLVCQPARLGRC